MQPFVQPTLQMEQKPLVCGAFLGFVFCLTFLKTMTLEDQRNVLAGNRIHTRKSEAIQLSSRVRVLCWIMTRPQNLEKKTRHVRATWANHCNKVLYMSSESSDFPTVGLNISEGRDQLYWKTIRAFQYIHTHHLDDADWFLKADDDTFVVVDNLRRLLRRYDTEKPVYLGHRFKVGVKQGYMSGGAGYVLSKEALKRFVQGFSSGQCTHTSPTEDMALGKCMENMKVEAGDSRDEMERETFNPFTPEQHLIRPYSGKQFWYYSYYSTKRGPNFSSDYAVSFHYISPVQMYMLDYYTHHLRAYGYKYRFDQKSATTNTTQM